jgi:hypothetical protein
MIQATAKICKKWQMQLDILESVASRKTMAAVSARVSGMDNTLQRKDVRSGFVF